MKLPRSWSNNTGRCSRVRLFGCNRMDRPALTLACEHETLVALLGDLGALPAIAADALGTEIGQEAARFAVDVCAHVPGVGNRHQCRVHNLRNMSAPYVLCMGRRLDGHELVS